MGIPGRGEEVREFAIHGSRGTETRGSVFAQERDEREDRGPVSELSGKFSFTLIEALSSFS